MSDWLTFYAYYLDAAGQDELLLHAWKPLADNLEAGGLIDSYFFIRYLEGGHHLRLRYRLADRSRAEAVKEATIATLTDYMARFPSSPPGNAVRWGVRGETPRPDNSIVEGIYEPEIERYGGRRGIEVAESHFRDSSAVVLDVLDRARRTDNRKGAKFAYALQLASILALGAGFKPHALHRFFEDYNRHLFDERETVDAVERYVQLYHQSREKLIDQFARLARIELDWSLGDDPLVLRWGRAVRSTCEHLEAALAEEGDRYADEFKEFRRRRKYVLVVQSYIHMLWNRLGFWGKWEEILCRLSADVWREVLLVPNA